MDPEYDFQARYEEVLGIIGRKEKVLVDEITTYKKLTESYKRQLPNEKQRLKIALEKLPQLRRSIETLEKKIERVEDKYEQTKAHILIVERAQENDILAMRKGNLHADKITNLITEIKNSKEKFDNIYQSIMLKRRGISKLEEKLENVERKTDIRIKRNKETEDKIDQMKKRSGELMSHEEDGEVNELKNEVKQKADQVKKEMIKLSQLKESVKGLEKDLIMTEKELHEISVKNEEALKKFEKAKVEKMCKVSKTNYTPKP